MIHRSTSRTTSPSYQQLYKAHSESTPRYPSSVSPTRNSFSLSVMPRARSLRSLAGAHPKSSRMEDAVYVADINPTYSVAGAVRCIAPVNDRIMWTAEYRGTLCIRALPKGTPLKELPGREDSYCSSLLYLPTEDVVWAGFQDGYLHVYNAKSMVLLKEVMAHNGGLSCMVEVDGSVITGGANWKMCQWDPTNGNVQLQRILHGHNGGVRTLNVYEGPTGAVVFSGSDDGTVRAWDPYDSSAGQGATDASIHTFTGHMRAVLALAVVSHANHLWSAGEDMTLRVWDMCSLSCLNVLRGGHTAPISSLMVVESRMWSADKHGHILIWDIATQSPLQDLAERVPYWGLGQGMVLAMQKVQLTSAYKVWTASSSGVLQCWIAETVPIIFDDVPISTGVLRTPSARAATAAATPSGGNLVDAVNTSALTVASVKNDCATYNSFNEDKLPALAPMVQMKEYIRSLQEELEETKRNAKLNYEKHRMEAQCEVETQQLLAQENDRLRERVRELEAQSSKAHEETSVPAQGSIGAASNHVAEDEVERLQSLLMDMQRQLDEALQRQRECVELSPEPQEPTNSSNNASSEVRISFSEWQRMKDQNDTLHDTVQRQIQLIDNLKKEAAEKEAQLADARAQLQDVEARLQEAEQQRQDATPIVPRQTSCHPVEALTEVYGREPPCVDGTARKEEEDSEFRRSTELVAVHLAQDITGAAEWAQVPPLAGGAGDEEDHEALKRYLHDQLKPMISHLKRARGELEFDNRSLRRKVEELTAQVQQQQKELEAERQRALTSLEVPAPPLATSSASDEEVQKLREDHEALNKYLHEHVKPMISRLKRAQGEMEVDLSRAREDLRRAYDMYDGAAAALEEEHVREEKMGEAMEALRKALEAEKVKNQVAKGEATAVDALHDTHAANSPTCRNFETPSGRPTEPTQLCGSADHANGVAVPPYRDTEKEALDKLVELNLDLSIRLADAETVIAQLQDSLDCTSRQLVEQCDETHRLLVRIQQYEQSRPRSPELSAADRDSSIDNVVSSPSPSKSPSRNRR